MKKVDVYTDGACSGNPGPGGWAALLRFGETEKELVGSERDTTNNRMEMMAVIAALEALKQRCEVHVHTDSKYVMDGATQWLAGWKKRGWKNAGKEPVKNTPLWQRLDEAMKAHDMHWHWVKGHAGHAENERVDTLAREQIDKLRAQGLV